MGEGWGWSGRVQVTCQRDLCSTPSLSIYQQRSGRCGALCLLESLRVLAHLVSTESLLDALCLLPPTCCPLQPTVVPSLSRFPSQRVLELFAT